MRSRTLIIGNKNYSSWSLRPWLFLRKNDIEFTEKILWLDEPAFKPEIEPLGSGGKVPVLLDGSITVWDSLAIIEMAIDRYSCQYTWPADANLRAHARSISCEMHSSFAALREECTMDIRTRNQIKLSAEAYQDVQRISEIWTQALESSGNQGKWLYGEFSAADAMYAPVIFRFEGYGIETSPLIRAYIDHALADKALIEWVNDAKQESHQIEY